MADDDAEGEPGALEDPALDGWRVNPFLARIDLHLVLKAEPLAARVDHQHRRREPAFDESLGAEDDRDLRRPRRARHCGPRAIEEPRISGGVRRVPEPAIAGHVALGEADHRGAPGACFGDRGSRSSAITCCSSGARGVRQVGEGDPDHGAIYRGPELARSRQKGKLTLAEISDFRGLDA